ncbi:hypothetical protein KQI65_01795 [bacterium]|nr:hypothetical protein [bacterium]
MTFLLSSPDPLRDRYVKYLRERYGRDQLLVREAAQECDTSAEFLRARIRRDVIRAEIRMGKSFLHVYDVAGILAGGIE